VEAFQVFLFKTNISITTDIMLIAKLIDLTNIVSHHIIVIIIVQNIVNIALFLALCNKF